jgi:hypothetical protein
MQFHEKMQCTYGTVDAGVFVPLILTLKEDQHFSFIKDNVKRVTNLQGVEIGSTAEDLDLERKALEKLYYRNFMWVQKAMSEMEISPPTEVPQRCERSQPIEERTSNCESLPTQPMNSVTAATTVTDGTDIGTGVCIKSATTAEQQPPPPSHSNNGETSVLEAAATRENISPTVCEQAGAILQQTLLTPPPETGSPALEQPHLHSQNGPAVVEQIPLSPKPPHDEINNSATGLQSRAHQPQLHAPRTYQSSLPASSSGIISSAITPTPRIVEINIDSMEDTLDFIHGLLLDGIGVCLSRHKPKVALPLQLHS